MITETRSTYQRQDDRLPLRGFRRSRIVVDDDTQLVKAHDRSDKPPVYLTGRRPGSCLPNEKDPVLESEDAEFEPRKTRRSPRFDRKERKRTDAQRNELPRTSSKHWSFEEWFPAFVDITPDWTRKPHDRGPQFADLDAKAFDGLYGGTLALATDIEANIFVSVEKVRAEHLTGCLKLDGIQ